MHINVYKVQRCQSALKIEFKNTYGVACISFVLEGQRMMEERHKLNDAHQRVSRTTMSALKIEFLVSPFHGLQHVLHGVVAGSCMGGVACGDRIGVCWCHWILYNLSCILLYIS